ncbi:MAG TPA: hypothetical protein VKQ36_14145 [Ktedonobacterales bacterium]|nr:hypothetical protein [Ktedonobacterales bacterium]
MDRSVWFRWTNLFLLLIPVVIFHDTLGIEEGPLLFVLAGLSLIPLAGFLKSAVEELEELLGEFIGALLHTTSGNAAELAIAVSVLLSFQGSGGAEIVLGSIAGVIVRTLLFLGLATFLGCLKQGAMKFDIDRAGEYTTVLALAVTGICLPTLAAYLAHTNSLDEASHVLVLFHRYTLSLSVSVVLLASYVAYIAFAVFRLREGFDLQEKAQRIREARRAARNQRRNARKGGQPALAGASNTPDALIAPLVTPGVDALFAQERAKADRELLAQASPAERQAAQAAEERPKSARRLMLEEKRKRRRENRAKRKGWTTEEEYVKTFLERTPWARGSIAFVLLVLAAAGVVYMSEAFAGSIEHILTSNPALKDYEFFIGLIIIPVLGGLVELVDAVEIARRGIMDVTMAMTAGGSVQMILLVTPILVITGALTGHPLDLFFKPLEVIIFGAATFIFMLLSRDGESTFLEGLQLCFLWLLLAVVAFFLPPI